MFFCVDCKTPAGVMVWFEPNPHVDGGSWSDAFFALGRSFEELMRGWAKGEAVVRVMETAWKAKNPGDDAAPT